MKISAIVTSLVLGISSVAAAAPSITHQASSQHTSVAARRFEPPMTRPAIRPLPAPVRWQLLDTAKPSRAGRQVIDVHSRARFTKLKLEATRGTAVIDKVLVTFANGRTQVIEVDKRLAGYGSASFTILDLGGASSRQISKIVVVSAPNTRASYSILAA